MVGTSVSITAAQEVQLPETSFEGTDSRTQPVSTLPLRPVLPPPPSGTVPVGQTAVRTRCPEVAIASRFNTAVPCAGTLMQTAT